MERLAVPWMFIGPSGSGKLTQARSIIEAAYKTKLSLPLETRNFTIGDSYEARVLASPYHFEIDIPNLSMQDKQIIGELLTMFFSSGDVFNGLRTSTRKLVILRRAHSLSQPAAIRVRAILQQYVLPSDAAGMVWITAREMTGPLSILEDAFVMHRIPRMPFSTWETLALPAPLKTHDAWLACEGRKERATEILKFFPDGCIPSWPRRIQDFYDEMIQVIIDQSRIDKPPKLDIAIWVRGRIYQALSFCQTGPEIIDSCAAALERKYDQIEPAVFWKVMSALTSAEPHTSYRTPLSLEAGLLTLFETLRLHMKKSAPIANGSSSTASTAVVAADAAAAPIAAIPKAAPKRRAAARPKAAKAANLG